MIARALVFFATFALLQVAWQRPDAERLRVDFIHASVAVPAAFIANQLTPQLQARAAGTKLRGGGHGAVSRNLNIVNGCDGSDMWFLLIAAFVVAPLTWRARVTGALLGSALVYLLNQARILALFYADGASASWFDLLHGYLAPLIMVLLIIIYFHGWMSRGGVRSSPQG